MADSESGTSEESPNVGAASNVGTAKPQHDIPGRVKAPLSKASSKRGPKAEVLKVKKPAAAPWTFPKATLEEAIKIARAVEEKNAGNPMRPEMLAKAVGFNSIADWRFLDLLRSANQYGLVTGSGKISLVGLTDIGRDVVAPSAPSARPKGLREAFRTVEDFQKVQDFYQGKKLLKTNFLKTHYIVSSQSRVSASEPSLILLQVI